METPVYHILKQLLLAPVPEREQACSGWDVYWVAYAGVDEDVAERKKHSIRLAKQVQAEEARNGIIGPSLLRGV